MLGLWLRILDIMDRLMNSGQGDHLEEAVPESLKNILLVMADGGFIRPPGEGQPRTELWDETVKRVNRFLPSLIGEIFPEVGKEAMKERENVGDTGRRKTLEEPASLDETQPQPQDVD